MASDTPPLVTIVIPTFNQAQYLPACVDHCLFQTYPELEIIIVDGGSTDGTKQYLDTLEANINSRTVSPIAYMDEHNRIIRQPKPACPTGRKLKILTFDRDIGATRTYNEGLNLASGKYCTYIVGDDLPHPHMIEEMVSILETGKADFVFSDMQVIDDSNRIIRQIRLPDYDFEASLAKWFHLGVSKLYLTELHTKVGLMDESYTAANDYDHYLRFAMAGCLFYHLPKILYSVRWHGPHRKTGQHTDRQHKILIEESKKCALRARAFLEGNGTF